MARWELVVGRLEMSPLPLAKVPGLSAAWPSMVRSALPRLATSVVNSR